MVNVKTCPNGVTCNGGNDIEIHRSWYAYAGKDRSDTYIVTNICPPGYCCGNDQCDWHNEEELCATNRDSLIPLCGKCKEGFYETLSSTGVCSDQCIETEIGWFFLGFGGGFALISIFFLKDNKDIPHPFITYIIKSMLYFYQIVPFITFQTTFKRLQS